MTAAINNRMQPSPVIGGAPDRKPEVHGQQILDENGNPILDENGNPLLN
jgi:hypothetical protein